MSDVQQWKKIDGAIVERPRSVTRHPLLERIYQRQDEMIQEHVASPTLEVAFGRHPHPSADVGVEAFPDNNKRISGMAAVTADARSLPFPDDTFASVIGRRFLHHVPTVDRVEMVRELGRVMNDGGNLVLLEGTPGFYRRFVKGVGFRLGFLGEDNDEYGHLSASELEETVREAGLDIVVSKSLGSPLMPFSILQSNWTSKLIGAYERTQVIRWWTLIIASRG